MSLSFQLARGLVALPLLAALVTAALLVPAPSTSAAAVARVVPALAVATDTCRLPAIPLRLALAPADLPRPDPSCRA